MIHAPSSSMPDETHNEIQGIPVENVVHDQYDRDENPFEKKKRKKTSKVWDDFKEVTLPNGSIKFECIYCKHQFGMIKSGATSHLLRHTKSCLRHKLNKGQQQLSINNTMSESVNVVVNFKYDHVKVRELFSHLIMVHELPFNLVEYELFNIFMRSVSHNYEKISRTIARNDCFASYELEKKQIKELLKSVNRVSVTTDF